MSNKERSKLCEIAERIGRLKAFLNASLPSGEDPIGTWMQYLLKMRGIQGNAHNDASFVALLLAKMYLAKRFGCDPFDATAKPQGAQGPDIEFRTPGGDRVVGEVKTTVPHLGDKLGGKQKTEFANDFRKLSMERAEYKFFFVTDQISFDIARHEYANKMPGLEVILLSETDAT